MGAPRGVSARLVLVGTSSKLVGMPIFLVSAPVLAAASGDSNVFGWFFYPVLFVAVALSLYCVFTIHRQPHLSEVQKLKWLLFTFFVPVVGPIAYFLRLRADKKDSAEV